MTAIVASNTVRYSLDPEAYTTYFSALVPIESITIPSNYTGSWRISFNLRGDYDQYGQPISNWAAIYKNGVQWGTFRSQSGDYGTFVENFTNINIASGTTIELWGRWNWDGATYGNCAVSNFRIEFDNAPPGIGSNMFAMF